MNRFNLDRGMGIRGLTGSRPASFEYNSPQKDPVIDAVISRKDANDSMNKATDQYEADVADFKNTIATEKEQGIAGLPQMNGLNNSPFISEGINSMVNKEPSFEKLPDFRDDQIFVPPPGKNPFDDIFNPPPFTPPFEPPIDEPPFTPPFTPPINEPPFTPPIDEPIQPPYDDRIDEPPLINEPPIDETPYVPPPPFNRPSGPINPYTGKSINNAYTPYATDSGATPLVKKINPKTFGQAPGFETTRGPSLPKPPIPPKRNDQIFVPPPDDSPKRVNMGGSLTNGIMKLPQSQQGDTMTTQMFQKAFRPRR